MRKRAHARALPILFWGVGIPSGGLPTKPPPGAANRHAHDPQVSGAPLAALLAQPHEEMGPRGSAAHLFCRATQGTGKPFAASFVHPAAGPLVEEAVRVQGHRGAAPYGVE